MTRKISVLTLLCSLCAALSLATGNPCWGADIKAIEMTRKPATVKIRLSGKAPYKVVQFDKTEILVAFKNTQVPETLTVSGDGGTVILGVKIAQRERDIVSLIITTGKGIGTLSALWLPSGNTLQITLAEPLRPGKTKKVKKRIRKKYTAEETKTAAVSPGDKTPVPSTVDETGQEDVKAASGDESFVKKIPYVKEEDVGFSLGNRTFDDRYSGSIEDLFLELRSDACEELMDVKRAVILCNQGSWDRAFEVFNLYGNDQTLDVNCLENVMILKAFSYFKSLEKKEDADYLTAISYFQDVIAYFPDSVYVPYALTCMGKIYGKMQDIIMAEGYFQVVLKNYKNYPGTPEVMFELGRIFTRKKENKLAVSILKNVVTQFPKGAFIGHAKLELGKALFNINDFHGSLKLFEDLTETRPRMVYDGPELLQYLGNAYYHTGNSGKARMALSRVFNLFPDIEGKDTILTRIGDTFVEENQKEKAINIFQLVVDTYPDTDGYVISTMRLAEFLESREEKENMYNMVIEKFPDNPLARLALMRLALLQHEAGEYERSVETVKKLLATHPRALKRDAVNLMQNSSERIFKQLLERDEYTELLSRFETDKKILDEAENPNLFLLVGMAYLKAHLHGNAVDMLSKAYKRTGEKKRPADLIYALGVAMDESGQADDALEMFRTFIRYFPDHVDAEDAYTRMGGILFDKKQFGPSVAEYKKALAKSSVDANKARILVSMARCYKETGEHGTAVDTLIKAINLLAEEPKESFDTLSLAHRSLGENYMQLAEWAKAADAFTMAVKFAGEDENTTEIYFMMGEAYQNNRNFSDAEKAYMNVVEKGDSFWSSMAKERLRSMKLKVKLENT